MPTYDILARFCIYMDNDRESHIANNPPLDFLVVVEGLAIRDPSVSMEEARAVAERYAEWANKHDTATAGSVKLLLTHYGFDDAASKIK